MMMQPASGWARSKAVTFLVVLVLDWVEDDAAWHIPGPKQVISQVVRVVVDSRSSFSGCD